MGQRSQMYVIAKKDDKYYLTANYYQWNYGERMISRARGTLENIIDKFLQYDWHLTSDNEKLRRIMDVNWDMHDVALSHNITKEFVDDYNDWKCEGKTYAEDFFNFCFAGQDNNDGQMYMYIDLDAPKEERRVKIGFTYNTFEENEPVVNANDYMNYNCEYSEDGDWIKYMKDSAYHDADVIIYTKNNIQYIDAHSTLMSSNELFAILTAVSEQYQKDYEDNQ